MTLTTIRVVIGTRTSQLATWQTNHVSQLLQDAWPGLRCQVEPFVTRGDKTLDQPLPDIGGKGLFTLELERALRDGRIDLAVHSLKDLPVEDAEGVTLGAIVGRADVRDVLVTRNDETLDALATGAVIGTSSLRRQAQLLAARPDVQVKSIRGNVGTRVRKVHDGEYDAAVLAAAGITRLGLDDEISQWLPLAQMLPAPGQGALGVQCRADDAITLRLLAAIDDQSVRACVTAERAFLHQLGGGCATPVAAHATIEDDVIHLTGLVAAPTGERQVKVEESGTDPAALGERLARRALAQGAGEILAHA